MLADFQNIFGKLLIDINMIYDMSFFMSGSCYELIKTVLPHKLHYFATFDSVVSEDLLNSLSQGISGKEGKSPPFDKIDVKVDTR